MLDAVSLDPHGGGARHRAGFPVVIIDDHELFSTTLAMALRGEGFLAHTRAATLAFDDLVHPTGARGLVVLDLDLGRDEQGVYVNGAEMIEGLRGAGWSVLMVSGSGDRPGIASAIAAGAVGAVSKSASFAELLDTIVRAADGETVMTVAEREDWLERHRRYRQQERELSRRLSRLSRREREVLELLADGMRAAAIADHFVVSMPTVRTQIRSILTKLETGSQLEAVALLRQLPDRAGRGD